MFHITTLEQTLIDTLHRPVSFGGPAVVFEIWEQALPRVDANRLIEHFVSMKHEATLRRMGSMLAKFDFSGGKQISDALRTCLVTVTSKQNEAAIQLLPGIEYHTLDRQWLVLGP